MTEKHPNSFIDNMCSLLETLRPSMVDPNDYLIEATAKQITMDNSKMAEEAVSKKIQTLTHQKIA